MLNCGVVPDDLFTPSGCPRFHSRHAIQFGKKLALYTPNDMYHFHDATSRTTNLQKHELYMSTDSGYVQTIMEEFE